MGKPRMHGVQLPPHVHRVKSRDKVYFYYQERRGRPDEGPRHKLPEDPQSPEFWRALSKVAKGDQSKTVFALVMAYRSSPEFAGLAGATKRDYTRYLDLAVERWGKFKAEDIRPKHLLAMRDSMADTPTTANHLVSIVKTLWQWGIPREYATINPARELKPIKVEREGAKPWPAWALKLIGERARWEVRTAVALGLYTGQRMADVVAMSMRDVTGDRIAVVQSKTNKRLTLPVHQSLAPVIEACRKRGVINLVPRPGGEAHNAEQFQALWQREMAKDWAAPLRAAKLSFHGLRKSAATTLKEIGATDAQIQSVTGMSKPMVELYTRHMDQEALALSAVQLWEASGR